MGRKRTTNKNLINTRIYPKRQKYYFYSPTPITNPKTGKLSKWHSLCHINEKNAELKARNLANEIIEFNSADPTKGDMPKRLQEFVLSYLEKREKNRPSDPEKIKLFETGSKDFQTTTNVIIKAFHEFNVIDVDPVDIAQFLDRYEDKKRMAQVYRSRLSLFFKFACRKGYRNDNPVDQVTVDIPDKRDVYITHEQFTTILDALLIDKNGNKIPTGDMVYCYVCLLYLAYQRGTEIRLLKWEQIKEDGIYFMPSKTEKSSSLDVIIPITSEIREILDTVKNMDYPKSDYVFITKKGTPYTASGIRSAWNRSCERAGISGLRLKDLRPKALTDAAKTGFDIEKIQVGAAHTDKKTTQGYIKQKDTPVSEIVLTLPDKKNNV